MENINTLFKETSERLGYKLIEFNLDEKYKKIAVVIYKPTGVSINDCEILTKELLNDIEYIDKFGREYNLEVSSPGVTRKFKSIEEYNIFTGKGIKITSDMLEGRNRVYTGVLKGVDKKNNILVENEYNLYKIPYSEIKKGGLVFEKLQNNHGGKL